VESANIEKCETASRDWKDAGAGCDSALALFAPTYSFPVGRPRTRPKLAYQPI
jgi:hypothetical protein